MYEKEKKFIGLMYDWMDSIIEDKHIDSLDDYIFIHYEDIRKALCLYCDCMGFEYEISDWDNRACHISIMGEEIYNGSCN